MSPCADIKLSRQGQTWSAAMAVAAWQESPAPQDRAADYLHPTELSYLGGLKFARRRQAFLLGRVAAKRAIARCASLDDPTAVEVKSGIFGQPLVISALCPGIEISLSHAAEYGLAVAFPSGHALGLDIEACGRTSPDILRGQMTDSELQATRPLGAAEPTALAVLWTAKEALSKILKCGLTVPFPVLAIETSSLVNGAVVCRFRNFTQYRSLTWLAGGFAVSLVTPWKTEIAFDPQFLYGWLAPPHAAERPIR
jgi:4'-phosphopantetheinyl transferase